MGVHRHQGKVLEEDNVQKVDRDLEMGKIPVVDSHPVEDKLLVVDRNPEACKLLEVDSHPVQDKLLVLDRLPIEGMHLEVIKHPEVDNFHKKICPMHLARKSKVYWSSPYIYFINKL